MSTMEPEDNDAGDLDQGDLEDLGDLGGGDEDGDEGGQPAAKPIPTPEEWAKIQRKLKRQEDRITRLTGTTPKGKPVADVDKEMAAQLRKGKPADEDDEPADSGEAARWRDIAIRNAASAQISAAGFTGTAKQAARLARLIETGNIEPDRNGVFDLEDEIEELQEEYPQLFAQGNGRRPAPSVRRVDSRQSAPAKDPTRSTSDALLKSAGYK